jgi:hypothetical protein
MPGLLATPTTISSTNVTPAGGALVASYTASASGFVLPSIRLTGLNTAGRQTLTLSQVLNDATNDHPGDRGSRIKAAAADTRMQLTGFATWLNVGDTLKVYVESSSASDTSIGGSVRFLDAINPTAAVETDTASRNASKADVSGLPTASFVIDIDTKVQAVKNKTDNLPSSPAAAGDAMTLTAGERTNLATAIWSAGSRTLTGFGTLVADVWNYATRTLTAFGFAVETDAASRTASQTDVSALASQASVTALGSPLQAGDYTAPDNAGIAAAAASAASADGKLDQVKERTDLIPDEPASADDAQASVQNNYIITETASSPASAPSSMRIVRGTVYHPDQANAFHWSSAAWPDLAGATITLTATSRQTGDVDLNAIACELLSDRVVRLSLTAPQTATLDLGDVAYDFTLDATLGDDSQVELTRGYIQVA